MTKIYVVRHCEAIGNQKRLFQGSSDFDITETGAEQLRYLTKRFESVKLDAVYSSPLIRAKKTALAIIGTKDLKPIIDNGLTEIDGGIVEGKPFIETFRSIPGLAETWDNHPEDFAPPKGEKMRNAYERIWECILKIAKENNGKDVALACHGGVIRCLNCRLLKGNISHLKEIEWSENTAITLLEFDDVNVPNVVYYNDISHLPKNMIPVRSRLSSFMGNNK